VRVDGRILADRRIRGRSFDFTVALPLKEVTLRVETGARTFVVPKVVGLPRADRPRGVRSRLDPRLQGRLRALMLAFGSTSAVYVQSLVSGDGGAWNARSHFPAASTLKVAIAIEALRSVPGKPSPGSHLDSLLRRMLIVSSDEAANDVLEEIGGSTSAGAVRVTQLLRRLGLADSEMFGGYLVDRAPQGRTRPIPVDSTDTPDFGRGKYTTAFDLARLLTYVHLASEGKGRLATTLRGQFTPSDARYLLWLLAHVRDPGKLDRFLPPGVRIVHKAGWISAARHDSGLVYTPRGVLVAVAMTWRPAGADTSSDVFAGRVARAALDFLIPRSSRRSSGP
jgi:beta-lactamase class A